MRCNICGNEIADGSLSCPFCGTAFSTGQQNTNGQIPYANGQYPGANGQNTYMNGQYPGSNGQIPYANGQIPYANGQYPDASGQIPYANGQNPYMQQPGTNPYIPAGNNPYIQPEYNPYIPIGYNGPDGQGYGAPAKPKKKSGKLIAIIISCIVLLAGLGVGAYFLFFKDKVEKPEEVARKYLEALLKSDINEFSKCYLPGTKDYHQNIYDISTNKSYYGQITIKSTVDDGEPDQDVCDELNNALSELYNVKCQSFRLVYCTIEIKDASNKESGDGRLILGKYNDKWYVVCTEDDPIESTSARDTAEKFIEAFEDFDTKEMLKYVHEEMKHSSAINDFTGIEQLNDLGVKLTFSDRIEISMSESDIIEYQENLKNLYNLSADDIKTFSYNVTLSYMGQSSSQDFELTLGKIGSKWYIIDGDYD